MNGQDSTSVAKDRPKLGFWMLTALVTGNMIGSGIFLLPSSLAHYGSISLLAWIFTATGAILLALVFATLAQAMPKLGGPYAYCRMAYGDFIGFLVAYTYWIALWVGNAAIVIALFSYLSIFFPLLSSNHWLCYACSVSMIWLLTLINIHGVQFAGRIQLVATVLKLLPLILLSFVGIFYIHWHNFQVFNVSGQSNWHALSNAASLTLWAFIGLESASVPADDVDNPQKTIARATMTGTFIAALVYIFSTIAVMGVIPMAVLQQANAPYADAASIMFGPWGQSFVAIGAVISCFGALNGWILLQGQIPMAAARDKLFPKQFANTNEHGTPSFALIVSGLCISLLLLLTVQERLVDQFSFIISLAVFATLVPYALCTMAMVLIMMDKLVVTTQAFRRIVALGFLAFLYSFWTIVGAGADIVYYGTLLLLSGVPIYAWIHWRIQHDKSSAR